MNNTSGNFVQKLSASVKADPKKASVLAILVAVLLGMWGKLILRGGNGPDKASAALAASVEDPKNVALAESENRDYARRKLETWLAEKPRPIERNLFAVKLDYFPQDASRISQVLQAPTGNGFWDDMAKSMTAKADVKRERQILVENLQLRAAQLRLQSTMMGAQPKALINGELAREGDVVASFRVLKIEPRRVIVEREGVKLEILMN